MKILHKFSLLFFCIALLQCRNTNAQSNPSLLFGPELNFKGKTPTALMKGKNGNLFAVDQNYHPDGWVYKINTQMELVGQMDLPLSGGEELFKIISFNDEIYFITLKKEKKKNIFYARKFDHDKLVTADSKKIYESDYKNDEWREYSIFDFISSEDNKTLVISERYNRWREETLNQFTVALDASLTEIWKRDISVPGFSGYFYNYVDSAGDFYFYQGKIPNGSARVDIYKTGKNIESFLHLFLTSEGKSMQSIRIKKFKDGELLTTGFYASNCDLKESTGIFCDKGMFSIILDDETGETISADYRLFGKEIFPPTMSTKEKESCSCWRTGKSSGSRNAFDMMTVIADTSGFIVIGEYQDVSTYSNMTSYSFYNIAVLAINTEGKLVWHSLIPRRASFTKSRTFGVPNYLFCYDTSNDQCDIYFNDHKNNLDTARVAAKGITYLDKINTDARLLKWSIEGDGSATGKKLAFENVDNEHTLFYPTCAISLNNKEYLFLADVKGKMKMGKITY